MLVRRSKAFLFFLSFFFLRVNKNTLDDELEEEFNNRNLKEKRDGFRENDNSPTTIIDGSRDSSCRVYYLVPLAEDGHYTYFTMDRSEDPENETYGRCGRISEADPDTSSSSFQR